MRLLVIGGGAREHALVARLGAEPDVAQLFCAPGNPGISRLAETVPLPISTASDIDPIVQFAGRERVDLTIVGPELPLSLGLADRLAAAGLPVLGPTAAAARIESSKAFAKAFMARHNVPTARFRTCDNAADALDVIRAGVFGCPVVLKADGLAAGKGVVIAPDRETAEEAIVAAMGDRKFGAAGDRLVIEECLTGPEVSFFVICDGSRAVPLGSAQDHKRIFDDDRGPNTGGMGAFGPSPLVDAALERRIMRDIVDPVVRGMAAEGYPFRGFLFAGLMLTAGGPKVIEFNARLGDPETQVLLPIIDEPLLPILAAAAAGELRLSTVRMNRDCLVGVVLASQGYPESADFGREIRGLDDAASVPGVSVYHAGTAHRDGRIVTAGGRVLTVVGRGPTYRDAIDRAYAGVGHITFDGMQYRRDIGQKALGL